MQIKVEIKGLEATLANITGLQKQIKFASARALTKTGQSVQKSLVQEMTGKFQAPTPWTLRSTFLKPATKADLNVTVGLKDVAYKGIPAAALLAHQFKGGTRIWKNLERWLNHAGLISAGEFIVPGKGAKLNQYGNMSAGLIQQIMSQLKVGGDPFAYATKSARSKRSQKRAGRIWWSHGDRLPRGAWADYGPPVGLRPLLIVTRAPAYKRRIDLARIADDVVSKEWASTFDAALADAIRTSA
jgi:hypothetical protein